MTGQRTGRPALKAPRSGSRIRQLHRVCPRSQDKGAGAGAGDPRRQRPRAVRDRGPDQRRHRDQRGLVRRLDHATPTGAGRDGRLDVETVLHADRVSANRRWPIAQSMHDQEVAVVHRAAHSEGEDRAVFGRVANASFDYLVGRSDQDDPKRPVPSTRGSFPDNGEARGRGRDGRIVIFTAATRRCGKCCECDQAGQISHLPVLRANREPSRAPRILGVRQPGHIPSVPRAASTLDRLY